jgi:hypothetical protein
VEREEDSRRKTHISGTARPLTSGNRHSTPHTVTRCGAIGSGCQRDHKEKCGPFLHLVGMVQLKQPDGHAPHRCQRLDPGSSQPEVVHPAVPTWVEEGRQLAGFRIERSQVGALVLVAHRTREGEVPLLGAATVFLGNDMVNPERSQGEPLRYQALLTTVAGPLPDEPSQRDWDVLLCHGFTTPST